MIKKNKAGPTRLNLKKGSGGGSRGPSGLVDPNAATSDYVPLNVIFNYNGHSFDAYETLGLPAGSNFDEVKKAYKDISQRVDKQSVEFYKAAYDSIAATLK